MSYSWPILSTVTFLPLLGALLIALLRGEDESSFRNARFIALWTTLITFALSLILWRDFDPQTAQFHFVELRPWLGAITFHMGVDGISLPFVLLTTFLMPLCILASWVAISTRVKEYMIAFLVLQTLMIGVVLIITWFMFAGGGLKP
jgi:NADH-quinone oxidoreductase subunit M